MVFCHAEFISAPQGTFPVMLNSFRLVFHHFRGISLWNDLKVGMEKGYPSNLPVPVNLQKYFTRGENVYKFSPKK